MALGADIEGEAVEEEIILGKGLFLLASGEGEKGCQMDLLVVGDEALEADLEEEEDIKITVMIPWAAAL